jgi:hypothetical protein
MVVTVVPVHQVSPEEPAKDDTPLESWWTVFQERSVEYSIESFDTCNIWHSNSIDAISA